MSNLRGRLHKLERLAGPLGWCSVCRGQPPSGTVVVEIAKNGELSPPRGVQPCRGCGKRGSTLWLEVDHREFPRPLLPTAGPTLRDQTG